MDFGRVLKRAWEITWRWKILWVLGFLAALGQQGSQGTSSYRVDGQELNLERYFENTFGGAPEQMYAVLGVVALLVCLLFIIAIIVWVVSVIARGGLIAGVQQVEDEGKTGFRSAWVAGRKKFWTLFGLGVLAAIPIFILIFVLIALAAAGIAAGVGMLQVEEWVGISGIILSALIFLGALCCVLIPIAIVLEQIRVYGERAAILEDLGWIEAFKRGWRVLVENLGATIVFWIIFIGIGIVIFVLAMGLMAVLAVPAILFAASDPGPALLVPLLCIGIPLVLVMIVVRSILVVFTSATWTLAYREMTSTQAPLELDKGE